MSWWVVLALTAGAAGTRLAGMFALGPMLERNKMLRHVADLLPAAVVAAVIAQLTLVTKGSLIIDARAAGLAAAGVLVYKRAPLIVVVVAAAVVTAGVRAIS